MGWYPHPTAFEYIKDQHLLRITFSDDKTFDYDTMILRGYCPCAHCQGHGSRPLQWIEPKYPTQIEVSDITQVGNYAACIAWADGHNTGVYSFEYLRELIDRPEEILKDYPPDIEKSWLVKRK